MKTNTTTKAASGQINEIMNRAKQLTQEEQRFLINVMALVDGSPEGLADAKAAFAEAEANNYNLHTEAGRSAFMAALKAV